MLCVLRGSLIVLALALPILFTAAAPSPPPPQPPSPPPAPGAAATRAYFVELADPSAAEVYVRTLSDSAGARAKALSLSKAQVSRLVRQQDTLEKALSDSGLDATILYRAQRTMNGIAVQVSPDRVDRLAGLPGVKRVREIKPVHRDTATSVPFIGTPPAWVNTGLTGRDVTIGIIDSGIDYLHRDFGGSGNLADYAANDPNVLGDVPFPTAKVAGGYDFVGDDYDASDSAHDVPQPDPDPMDASDHGTHVAGIAAGFGVNADGSTYTGPYDDSIPFDSLTIGPGVAPEATLYALKVFGRTGTSVMAGAAIEWAVDPNGDGDFSDHLDILNLSLGAPFEGQDHPDRMALEGALSLGIVVVTSAGNNGDTYFITGGLGAGDGAISVANSADDGLRFPAMRVESPASIAGDYAAAAAAFGAPLSDPGVTAELADTDPADGCESLSVDVTGKIALIDRGVCNFTVKVRNAQQAGAVGVILVNNEPGPPITPGDDGTGADITIPCVMISRDDGDVIKNALASSPVVVNLSSSVILERPELADTLSRDSSRGPRADVPVALKPDVAAPGTGIASAGAGTGTEALVSDGTSMSAPHVAGAMALLREQHPDWSVAELKAALMNTAHSDLFQGENFTPPRYGLGRVGAGRVHVDRAAASSVIAFDSAAPERVSVTFQTNEVVGSATETRIVRVVNKGSSAVGFTAALDTVTDVPGVAFDLPGGTALTVPPGGAANLPVRLTADADAMKHTRDETVSDKQSGEPRNWLSEEGGYLVLTPQGDHPALRVSLYAVLRPASDMHVAEDTVSTPTPTGSGTLQLTGQHVDNGATPPFDEVSRVTPLALQYISPNEPASVGRANRSDLRFVGVASTVAGAGDVSDAWLYFGIAAYADESSPARSLFYIAIDTDMNNQYDYYLFNSDTGSFNGDDANDVFVSVLQPVGQPDSSVIAGPMNGLEADEGYTGIYLSDVRVLPVSAAALGLGAGHSAFQYVVFSYRDGDVDWILVDSTPYLRFDVARPGLDFSAGVNGPAIRPDRNGTSLSYQYDLNAVMTNDVYGGLFLHHHNASGKRAEVRLGSGSIFADDDGDGLPNNLELSMFGLAAASSADTDSDGLNDRQEVIDYGTSPTSKDSDGDTLEDGWEVEYGLDATDAGGDHGPLGDPDGDELSNAEERSLGTDPKNRDTDRGGVPDGEEVANGTDPLNPADDTGDFPGDVNHDDVVNAVDVQLVINAVLGIAIDPSFAPDINGDTVLNAVDVQLVINAVLEIR